MGRKGKHIRTREEPAQKRSTPHLVSGQAAFKEGFMDYAGAVTSILTHTVGAVYTPVVHLSKACEC